MAFAAFDPILLKLPWNRTVWEGIPFHRGSALSVMPGLHHGFTTRIGGCSKSPYSSLNMSINAGDAADNVAENRRRVAGALGFSSPDIVTAEQVHGSTVGVATMPGDHIAACDALITDRPNLLLMLMFADCVPVYLFDPLNRAIGIVHSGWRGTAANVVQEAVTAMTENYGTNPSTCMAAIGPCISFEKYEVSLDVAERFRNSARGNDTGSAQIVLPNNEFKGTYLLNLRQVIFQQLTSARFRIESIAVSDQCTFSNKRDFFSHRRDASVIGKTGRMAGVIGLKPLSRSRGIN